MLKDFEEVGPEVSASSKAGDIFAPIFKDLFATKIEGQGKGPEVPTPWEVLDKGYFYHEVQGIDNVVNILSRGYCVWFGT